MPFSPRYLIPVIVIVVLVFAARPGYLTDETSHPMVTTLEMNGMPERTVFIADPHLREGNEEDIHQLIRQINRLSPSLVLIGGDFTCGDEHNLSLQDAWRELDAPVYAVLGNHDYRAGINGGGAEGRMAWVLEILLRARGIDTTGFYSTAIDSSSANALEKRLEENGMTILRNEAVDVSCGGRTITLVGVDDLWAGKADPPAVVRNGFPVIYLVHEPVVYPDWDADMVLSGHTHGGQFNNAPFQLLDLLEMADIRGFHQKGDVPLYVTRGVGTSDTRTDRRFLTPPEIVLINPGA
ncbi:MAG: metallophosphoesterase [Methanoregulaceae archaeon]|nr:metallophosphoesterase [Methanoregulaceae archaeon]